MLTLLALVLAGGWIVWFRHRRDPLTVVLALAALVYLGTLPLRLIPDAWETASRASEFLFLGVALLAGLALSWQLERRPGMWMRSVAAGLIALVVCGGIIAGWPSGSRLARPLRITVAGNELLSPSYVAADWTGAELGTGRRIGAEDADARLLLTRARQTAIEGTNPDVQDVLRSDLLEPWMPQLLRDERIGYLVTDRRKVSSDNILGLLLRRRHAGPVACGGGGEVRPRGRRPPLRRRRHRRVRRAGAAMKRAADLRLVALLAVVCALICAIVPDGATVVRTLPAALLVLVLPGYALTAALLAPAQATRLERLVLTIAMSMVAGVLTALVLNAGWHLETTPWATLLALVTVIAALAGARRGHGQPVPRPRVPRIGIAATLALTGALLLTGGAIALGVTTLRAPGRHGGHDRAVDLAAR